MSLKFFHLLFIGLSALMSLGVAIWAVDAWRSDNAVSWLVLALVAIAGGGGLVVYGSRFLQKFRKLGIAGLVMAGALAAPPDALACPACVSTTQSALQDGMNTGILMLLGVTGFMLVCFAIFFVSLARHARQASLAHAAGGGVRESEFTLSGSSSGFGVRTQEGSM